MDTRAIIQTLFDAGNLKAAGIHRWHKCATSSECGYACPALDKDADQKPSCPEGNAVDLYAFLKRPDFRCPRGHF